MLSDFKPQSINHVYQNFHKCVIHSYYWRRWDTLRGHVVLGRLTYSSQTFVPFKLQLVLLCNILTSSAARAIQHLRSSPLQQTNPQPVSLHLSSTCATSGMLCFIEAREPSIPVLRHVSHIRTSFGCHFTLETPLRRTESHVSQVIRALNALMPVFTYWSSDINSLHLRSCLIHLVSQSNFLWRPLC